MSNGLESKLLNADMQAAPRALLRAARRAREIARQTGTLLVVVRNGVLIEIDPAEIDRNEDATLSRNDIIHDGERTTRA